MGTRRDLTAFVLLAQLVSLSSGNIEGEPEKIVSNNASSVLIENKGSVPVDEALENVASLNGEYNKFSMAPEATTLTTTESISALLKDEKILEDKLKEALESAASTARVIMISPAVVTNLTKRISGPLIVIESSRSSIEDSASDDETTIDRSSRISDQEIAQSQIRTRSDPESYVNHEDIENIEHLLAIAEYEPQKLDASGIEATSTETSRDQINSRVQTTGQRLPEETHYDVPRRKNLSRNSQRQSEYNKRPVTQKTILEESSIRSKLIPVLSSDTFPIKKERAPPRLELPGYNYNDERKRSSLPLFFREKSIDGEWSREPRHLKPSAVSSTTNSSTTLISRLPKSIEEPPKSMKFNNRDIQNFTDSSVSAMNNLHTFPTVGKNKIFLNNEKIHDRPTVETLKISQTADRRIDDHPSTKIQPIPNDRQLGFLTRYNLPLLVVPRLAKTRSYTPVALPYKRVIASTDHTRIYNDDESDDSAENVDSKKLPTNRPVYDYHDEDSNEKSPSSQGVSLIDRSRKYIPSAETTSSYDSNVAPKIPRFDRKNDNLSPTLITPVRKSYENYEKSESPKSIAHQRSFIPRVEQRQELSSISHAGVSTEPNYQPYGYPVREASPFIPVNLSNARIYSHQRDRTDPTIASPSNAYSGKNNYPQTLTEQLPKRHVKPVRVSHDSYEDSDRSEESPRVTNSKIRNSNYVDLRYDNSTDVQTPRSISVKPKSQDYRVYRKENVNDLSPLPENTFASLTSSRLPLVNPQRASSSSIKISMPAHVKSSHEDSNENDEKTYSPTDSSPRAQKFGPRDEHNNQQTSSVDVTSDYDYDDSTKRIDNSPESTRPTSNEPESPNYGSRVRTLLVLGHDENSPYSRAPAHRTRLTTLPLERNEKLGIVGAWVNEKPGESVHRADVIQDDESRVDEEPASSGHEENYESHEKSKEHDGDEKSEKGGGEKHVEGHHSSDNEKAEKGYKEWHEYDEGKKGHRDSESHENEYDEAVGEMKKHEDASGYHKEHHHDEKGSKESEYGEKGEHQKGHSTKGQHVVHKKDEYEKKTEFYDESHEEDGNEKEGEYHYAHEDKKGGHEKIGHHDSANRVSEHGEKGEHEKGRHWDETKGHEDKDGGEREHRHEEKYGKKGGHEEGEKWSHKSGDDNGKRR